MNNRNRVYSILIVFLIGIFFTACGAKRTDTPWSLTNTLSASDISSAIVWADMDDRIAERALSAEEIDQVIEVINQISDSAFTDNAALSGTTPEYGLRIANGDRKFSFSQNIGPYGAIEFSMDEKTAEDYFCSQWHIDSDNLAALIVRLSGYKKTEAVASDTDINIYDQRAVTGKFLYTFTGGYVNKALSG